MFELFIQNAYAQGVVGAVGSTAVAGRDAATQGAEAGLQALISYVIRNLDNWIAGIVVIVLFYILARMSAAAIKKTILKEKEDVQESALILVERITRIVVLIIGVTIAFALNGLNFTAVIGALSLGIGFAMKDILSNFISGVIMLAQDRIKIGDFIKVGDILGTIVSIDTRATILQAIDGTEVVIPNQNMLGQTLISYSTNPFRRIDLEVGVAYDTNLPMVTSLIRSIIDKDQNIVIKPEPMILVNEFGNSSINIMIRFWVESSADWQNIRSNLAHRIKQAFDEVGVTIPFPIRTLKLDEDDRSFLKTMDSMKKGIVPEVATVPTKEEVAKAAGNTEHAVKIPYSVFQNGEGKPTPNASTNPTPAAAPAPAQSTSSPAAPAAPTVPAPAPAPNPLPKNAPPTHL